MTWIQTFSGKKFSFLDPQPKDICIKDIAHHLGNLCRFVGATRTFYSVAQHSVLVSTIVPDKEARNGLLHDAGEAYYGDISSPLKMAMEQVIGKGWNKIIKRIDEVIKATFNFSESINIKWADQVALATEIRDLIPYYNCVNKLLDPLKLKIIPMSPTIATITFLQHYWRLTNDSNYFCNH